MKLSIEIDTDNAAFEDNLNSELQTIFKRIAFLASHSDIPDSGRTFGVYDSNGNTVGSVTFSHE